MKQKLPYIILLIILALAWSSGAWGDVITKGATVRKFRIVRQEGNRCMMDMSAITKMQMSPEFILKCIK